MPTVLIGAAIAAGAVTSLLAAEATAWRRAQAATHSIEDTEAPRDPATASSHRG